MHSRFLKSLGLAALVAVSPIAVTAQEAPPPPADPMPPSDPVPPETPPAPGEPMPTPPAPAPAPAPMPEPMPMPQPPVDGSTNAPAGPMATPPASAADSAQSGGTTSAMMTPQAATKEYPPCTKTLQDNCRNPGEGPKATRKKRR